MANKLISCGVQKGDVVATFMYNSLEQALIWFGCAKMGAIYAPLNVSLVRDDLAYSLNDTGAKLFILDEELAPAYNAAKTLLTLDPRVFVLGNTRSIENNAAECFEDLTTGDDTLPDIEIKSTDPMAIVYTGGVQACQKAFWYPTCIILVQLFVMLRLPKQQKTTSILLIHIFFI